MPFPTAEQMRAHMENAERKLCCRLFALFISAPLVALILKYS